MMLGSGAKLGWGTGLAVLAMFGSAAHWWSNENAACAKVSAQGPAASRPSVVATTLPASTLPASASSIPNKPQASEASIAGASTTTSSVPLFRGWLKELLDRDLVGACAAYEEALQGDSSSRDQQVLALARLAEIEGVQGSKQVVEARLTRLRTLLTEPFQAPALIIPDGEALAELRRAVLDPDRSPALAERIPELRKRVRAALQPQGAPATRFSPRQLLVRLMPHRGKAPQLNLIAIYTEKLKAAETRGDHEIARQLHRDIDDLHAQLRTSPPTSRELVHTWAIEIVLKRLEGKTSIALRLEEAMRVLAPGRVLAAASRPEIDPRREVNQLNGLLKYLLKPGTRFTERERDVLERCARRVAELVEAKKFVEARELLRPVDYLRTGR